ncbi:MAG: redoxin domain-containing protein [Candidatus Eremiobacteraeota bacterium]|nr:redoxin domain-containing protein [Candidatus Eremiobacteraeota bacterium]
MLQEGQKAPSVAALDDQGVLRRLDDFAGAWLVLWFYSKDATPG